MWFWRGSGRGKLPPCLDLTVTTRLVSLPLFPKSPAMPFNTQKAAASRFGLAGRLAARILKIRIHDEGRGIAQSAGDFGGALYASHDRHGVGNHGRSKRLMDEFQINSDAASAVQPSCPAQETSDSNTLSLTDARIGRKSRRSWRAAITQSPLEEVQNQNRELIGALSMLCARTAGRDWSD